MVIVIKDNKVEVLQISEEELKQFTVGSAQVDDDSNDKKAIDLYKMEYERGAQRYDDLYSAAWTNFSYMAVVAGALLTFGSDRFMPELSIFLACLPILFWWLASFEPLNRYGDQVQARLKCDEIILSELCKLNTSDERDGLCDWENCTGIKCERKGLRHFRDFDRKQVKVNSPLSWLIALGVWLAVLIISLERLHLWQTNLLCFLVPLMIVLLVVWLVYVKWIRENISPGRALSQLLRVRSVVRIVVGGILVIAICSAYGAYQRRHKPASEGESYIKRTSETKT